MKSYVTQKKLLNKNEKKLRFFISCNILPLSKQNNPHWANYGN